MAEHCAHGHFKAFSSGGKKNLNLYSFCTICTLLVFHEWFLFEISFCCWNVKDLRDPLNSFLNREHLAWFPESTRLCCITQIKHPFVYFHSLPHYIFTSYYCFL